MKLLLWMLITNSFAGPTYTQDIQSLFKERCSACHDSMPGKDWQSYKTAYDARFKIRTRVFDVKDMPQGNVTNMTDAERELVKKWVDMGAKE